MASWRRAVVQAERLVGYPTSFMSLRHLLSDEAAQVALQLRRLVGSDHPLLSTARALVADQRHLSHTRGLVLLLLAKAATPSGIRASQRGVAEIAETIHAAGLIHRGIVAADGRELAFGNRLATLSGDFLLAAASTGLAELHSRRCVALLSAAIADLVEAEFGPVAAAGDALPRPCALPHLLAAAARLSEAQWRAHVRLSRGSLLSAAAAAVTVLAEAGERRERAAARFAGRWAALHRLREEMGAGAAGLDPYGLPPRPGLPHILFAESGRPPERFLDQDCPARRRCRRHVEELAGQAKRALDDAQFPNREGVQALHRLVDGLSEPQ